MVGVHERNAPLDRFEKLAVGERDLSKALRRLCDSPNLSEAVVLSTCMRTEVYAVAERFHDGLTDIGSFLSSRVGEDVFEHRPSLERLPDAGGGRLELGEGLNCWYDDAAVAHLFEVAAGLDSPVLGEGEVLRQVREAAERARAEDAAGPVLSLLFRHAVEAGKRARSETAISRGTTSLAHAVVQLAADEALGLDGRRILVIGAGEMGSGVAKALSGRSDLTGLVVVANRGAERAAAAADLVAGKAVGLDRLEEELAEADVVITSTAAAEVVIGRETISSVARTRAEEGRPPLVVVDAAVPRDVDPAAAELPGVVLRDLEDVRRFAEEQMAGRSGEVPAVRRLLADELERYRTTAAGRLAAPIVAALRERSEELRLEELARHRRRLAALSEDERRLVEEITRGLVAKLVHGPTVAVKQAAGSPRGERLAEALRTLFDL